jgi:hypothetical protein
LRMTVMMRMRMMLARELLGTRMSERDQGLEKNPSASELTSSGR